ncbi:serine/threonine-protein phosphatase [Kitasatospora sp. NA04385]|uniref:PP2C family protein-serine/threonine phosphatase n=1 Tax=Kitasatospora sp. NA04385 TaxID=2742135 RepID=UPI0015920180|nr:PP2C family protein-serine/threonine phosphatase [Kitasatospora sp. NA04385]QKW17693.1 serine/threonine-protein phosphatase [Kitasatospora sp. NA04385]
MQPRGTGVDLRLPVLPFAAMAAVAAVGLSAGPEVGHLALFSIGPAFACVSGTVRRALLVGAPAFVLCTAAACYDGLFGSRRATVALASVAGVTAAAALAAALRRRAERELADVRSVAEAAQRVLLRPVPTLAGPVRLAVSYTSAAAAARIGGDLYEVVPTLAGTTRVVVGDVRGKGLDAVETAAVVLGAFREATPDEPDLEAVGARIERALDRRLDGEEFVSAILAEITADGTVTLLNYGHPPPLVVRADSRARWAEPARCAPPLGLAGLGPAGPEAHDLRLGSGDQLLLYTDGVTETRDHTGEFYPLPERAGLLSVDDPDGALEALRRDVAAHAAGPLKDDAAMMLLRRRSDEPA